MRELPRPEEHLTVDTWKALCEEIGGRLVYAQTEVVNQAFLDGLPERTVLVTAWSDCGLHLQERAHPNADLFKTAMVGYAWERYAQVRDRYVQVQVGPACQEGCVATDRYVVKMERFAYQTFERIPEHLTWFSANVDIAHPGVHWIPFGVNDQGDGKDILADLVRKYPHGRPKKGLLYVNFTDHTLERLHLKQHYAHLPWVTFRENVSVSQYYDEMSEHEFVLSPRGNGLDCYRNLEAIYLGTVPVLADSQFARQWLFHHLPVLLFTELMGISESALRDLLSWFHDAEFDLGAVTRSYWKNRLEQS